MIKMASQISETLWRIYTKWWADNDSLTGFFLNEVSIAHQKYQMVLKKQM